jgi:hypothetical protein
MYNTYVTKTSKEFGYHVYWFEDWKEGDEDDFVSIDYNDCKSEASFEIMVGVQYCQVLGRHRDPLKVDFRYGNVGCKGLDRLEIMYRNGQYDQLLEKFKDILDLNQIKKRRKLQQKSKDPFHTHLNPNGSKDQTRDSSSPCSLTLAPHQTCLVALWVEQFYAPGKHYFFMRPFPGTLVWGCVNQDSVIKIIDKICSDKSDLSSGNKQKWYGLLSDAYQRISDGLNVEGRYTLVRALQRSFGFDEKEATQQI